MSEMLASGLEGPITSSICVLEKLKDLLTLFATYRIFLLYNLLTLFPFEWTCRCALGNCYSLQKYHRYLIFMYPVIKQNH